jgi:hypothetical protein
VKAVQDIVLTFTRGAELSIPPAPIVLVYLVHKRGIFGDWVTAAERPRRNRVGKPGPVVLALFLPYCLTQRDSFSCTLHQRGSATRVVAWA